MPLQVWTIKRYGLKNLVASARADLEGAIGTYDDLAEVRMFGGFLNRECAGPPQHGPWSPTRWP